MQKATLKMIKTRAGAPAGDAAAKTAHASEGRLGGGRTLLASSALGTAARTAAMFGPGDPGTGEPRASGPLRLLPGDLPQGP